MKKFVLQQIQMPKSTSSSEADQSLIQRLYDLGLYPGLEVELVGKISFGSVYIIQFGETRIALNSEEFSCLHGL